MVVRYVSGEPWAAETGGQPVSREALQTAFPHPGFQTALEILAAHGHGFRRVRTGDFTRIGPTNAFHTERIRLDCALLGFEISLRSRAQHVVVIPRAPERSTPR